jgi:Flp pilus assembly protein TadG
VTSLGRALRARRAVRALRARRAGREERGSVLVEAAIVVPLLILLTFGAIEFGIAFRDSASVASSTRAGARIASALTASDDACAPGATNCTAFSDNVALSVSDSLKDLMTAKPTTLVIYRADANGNAIGGFGVGCTDCYVYTWNAATKTWVAQAGTDPWTRAERLADACQGTLPSVGVYVKATQPALTRLFGPSRTFNHKTAMRLEPPSGDEC